MINDDQLFQLKNEGKFIEAIEMLEVELASFGNDIWGYESIEISKTLCEFCNLHAMNLMQHNQFDHSLTYLRRAEFLSEKIPSLKAITYNNLALFYRKQNKQRISLKYLQRALLLEPSGDIHLNLCAVLSQIGKHEQALEQAMHAIIYLQDELFEAAFDNHKNIVEERSPVLAVAYHNLAVELEFLRRISEANSYYLKAVAFAKKHLPKETQLIDKLESVLVKVLGKGKRVKVPALNVKRKMRNSKSPIGQKRSVSPLIYQEKSKTQRFLQTTPIRFEELKGIAKTAETMRKYDDLPIKPNYPEPNKETEEQAVKHKHPEITKETSGNFRHRRFVSKNSKENDSSNEEENVITTHKYEETISPPDVESQDKFEYEEKVEQINLDIKNEENILFERLEKIKSVKSILSESDGEVIDSAVRIAEEEIEKLSNLSVDQNFEFLMKQSLENSEVYSKTSKEMTKFDEEIIDNLD